MKSAQYLKAFRLLLMEVSCFSISSIAADKQLSIPSGSLLYVGSKSHSDDAELFKEALIPKLLEDESSEQCSKPGSPIIVGYEDGDYRLLFMIVMGAQMRTAVADDKNVMHAIVNVSLIRVYDGKEVWARKFDCAGIAFKEAAQQCIDLISDELKSVQFKKGKRAGILGWQISSGLLY